MSSKPAVRTEPDGANAAVPTPTVSIILPVLNEEAQLGRCLRSVAEQTYPAVAEILVADGGSTDNTRSVAEDFPNVSVVDNPRHIRPSGLNAAIAAASGDIIVRVDARTARARLRRALCRGDPAVGGGHRRRPDALRGRRCGPARASWPP